jgi:hypothetical protein
MFAPEGMENRAMAEGRFFHSPHGGSGALDFTKYDTPLKITAVRLRSEQRLEEPCLLVE